MAWGLMALRRWLGRWLGREPDQGRLEAILITEAAGADMRSVARARALPDLGLEGDRYAAGRGWWRATDGCQVTLIHSEHLARAARRTGLDLRDGRHRRNLVVSGLANRELRGQTLQIGEAQFAWHRLRPPCGYLDQVSGRGSAKALGKHGGVCLKVIRGGDIGVGDPIQLLA